MPTEITVSNWPTLPTIPTSRHGRGNVCFQASSKHPKVRLRKVLPVPFKYSGKCQDNQKPRSGTKNTDNLPIWGQLIHNCMEARVSSPIPDTHFAHQLTVLLHTRGRPFLLVHATYKIGTFQRKPVRSHRRHNCALQGSACAHYTRAYLTSTVSATLGSLLFLDTAQLPQVAITH